MCGTYIYAIGAHTERKRKRCGTCKGCTSENCGKCWTCHGMEGQERKKAM